MKKTYKGRVILPAAIEGEALVTSKGFNNLACFYQSILAETDIALCSDQDNPELFGQNLTGKIICLPRSIGSTTAGATWYRVAQLGIAPKAMLFSQSIDSLAAAGLILAEVWLEKRICTVDRLGERFLDDVRSGMRLRVYEDGMVEVL